jgi:hypothetical protein
MKNKLVCVPRAPRRDVNEARPRDRNRRVIYAMLVGRPLSPAERARMVARIVESRVPDPQAPEIDEIDATREYLATQAALARRLYGHASTSHAPRRAARPRATRRSRARAAAVASAGSGDAEPDPAPEAPHSRDAGGRRDGRPEKTSRACEHAARALREGAS